jgi:Meiotically up-regulated gene 113
MENEQMGKVVELYPTGMTGGYVYFVRALYTPFIKIGYTESHPRHRLKDLQGASPYALELIIAVYTRKPWVLEKKLQKRFAEYRHRGEWFALPEEIVSACEMFADLFLEGKNILHAPLQGKRLDRFSMKQQHIFAVLTPTGQHVNAIAQALGLVGEKAKEVLRITLHRLVQSGEIVRTARACYALPIVIAVEHPPEAEVAE